MARTSKLRYRYRGYDYHDMVQEDSTSKTISSPGVSPNKLYHKKSPLCIEIYAPIEIYYAYLVSDTRLHHGIQGLHDGKSLWLGW